ncbi:FadR/GntR family transcriptional regulator [Paractinoplanes toevensis]|uniref:GntR family transcriptional regulator n=1 Tax=Paractinoplanes toevensis TaxID=571911 RepID=A0A919VZN8_9ACTN|nr:FCD domain-containing protein [Actinoplanes toevensis]GIM88294.1 GntR family transcriptional regulator [Actinoplanes toevensis]
MSLRSPVRQAPLVMQVAEQFRGLVESGAWAVGEKIPGEVQLAGQLGVSRGTVREALRALSLTGILEPRVGDGTYVRATNEITGVLVRDDLSPLTAVLDVRAGLEAAAARLAAGADVAALDAALAARARAHDIGDRAGYVEADAAFHRGVIRASGNPLLLRLYDAVAEVINQSIVDTAIFPEDPVVRDSHAALRDAIRDGDREAAVSASYGLIESVKTAMEKENQ